MDNSLLNYTKYLEKQKLHFNTKSLIYYLLIIVKYIIILFRNILPDIKSTKLDILILGTTNSDVEKSQKIWDSLQNKNYKIKIIVLNKKDLFLKSISFKSKIHSKTPTSIFFHAVYSEYLILKYCPKVICSFIPFGPIPSLLKSFNKNYSKTIYIPHCIIPSSSYYSSIDYDYYFVFGDSSINNLNLNKFKYGSTKIVKTGSPWIQIEHSINPCFNFYSLIYFANWLIGKDEIHTKNFNIILDFIKQNKNYNLYIKLHPIAKNENYIKKAIENINNVILLPINTSLEKALKDVAIALINPGSTTGVEAALMKRPPILVNYITNNLNSIDYMDNDIQYKTEYYFVEKAKNHEELLIRIKQITSNYEYYLSQCDKYVNYHLANKLDSQENIIFTIEKILKNNIDFEYTELKGNF